MPVRVPRELRERPIIGSVYARWGVILATLLGLTLFFVAQNVVWRASRGDDIRFQILFTRELVYWIVWAPLIPIMVGCLRRYPLLPGTIRANIWPNLGLSLLIAPLHEVGYRAVGFFVVTGSGPREIVDELVRQAPNLPGSSFTGFYKYWAMLAIYAMLIYYRRYTQESKRANRLMAEKAQLEADLRNAQLEALKMQLQPHFLFNTLNTISFLMAEDTETANRMLLRFSELLRISLDEASSATTSMRQELAFIERYLEIESMRFADRLRPTFEVDPDSLDAEVPFMIMQPIVENAVRHGIENVAEASRVAVSVERRGDRIRVTVSDDGPGFGAAETEGLGLANTRRRLDRMFGEGVEFSTHNLTPRGARVQFSFPFRMADEDNAGTDR